jgi:hypothetical protein
VVRYRSDTIVALEAWYETTRALREAQPGSAEWHRLRMTAEDQRAAYESLIEQVKSPPGSEADRGERDAAISIPGK